jgi:chromosome segregation ATPase
MGKRTVVKADKAEKANVSDINVEKEVINADAELLAAETEVAKVKAELQALKKDIRKDKDLVKKSDKKQDALKDRISKLKNRSGAQLKKAKEQIERMKAEIEKLIPEKEKIAHKADLERVKIKVLEDELLEVRAEMSVPETTVDDETVVRRARTRFIKNLSSKEWAIRYDSEENPIGAEKNGTELTFDESEWTVTSNGETETKKYGRGAAKTAEGFANKVVELAKAA